jgi:hypothetical protein
LFLKYNVHLTGCAALQREVRWYSKDAALVSVCSNLTSDLKNNHFTLQVALRYNEKFVEYSKDAALVLINLPTSEGYPTPKHYLSYVDVLTAQLPRVLLVRGTNKEVVTSFL